MYNSIWRFWLSFLLTALLWGEESNLSRGAKGIPNIFSHHERNRVLHTCFFANGFWNVCGQNGCFRIWCCFICIFLLENFQCWRDNWFSCQLTSFFLNPIKVNDFVCSQKAFSMNKSVFSLTLQRYHVLVYHKWFRAFLIKYYNRKNLKAVGKCQNLQCVNRPLPLLNWKRERENKCLLS